MYAHISFLRGQTNLEMSLLNVLHQIQTISLQLPFGNVWTCSWHQCTCESCCMRSEFRDYGPKISYELMVGDLLNDFMTCFCQVTRFILHNLFHFLRAACTVTSPQFYSEFCGISWLKPARLGLSPRQKMNLLFSPSFLPFFYLPFTPPSPCRPPARSNTVNLIPTNKPGRLGSQSWPAFVGSTFCHTLDLKGVREFDEGATVWQDRALQPCKSALKGLKPFSRIRIHTERKKKGASESRWRQDETWWPLTHSLVSASVAG